MENPDLLQIEVDVMDLGLKDKRVIITGASKGIGFAIAKLYSIEGAKVLISSRSEKDLKIAKEEIEKESHNEVLYISCDLMKKMKLKHFLINLWINYVE